MGGFLFLYYLIKQSKGELEPRCRQEVCGKISFAFCFQSCFLNHLLAIPSRHIKQLAFPANRWFFWEAVQNGEASGSIVGLLPAPPCLHNALHMFP